MTVLDSNPDRDAPITLEICTCVATVTLARPPVNAIDDPWIACLDRILDQVEARPGVAVLHFRSALKCFCAGADLKVMRAQLTTPAGRDGFVDMVRRLQKILARIEKMGAVSVAEISGAALGGGLEFALACDLRCAAESAKLGLPEATLGLLPAAGGTQRLPRVCGEATARRLILGAEIVDGAEARRIGLVQWVLADDQLASWTENLVHRLAALPAEAGHENPSLEVTMRPPVYSIFCTGVDSGYPRDRLLPQLLRRS